MGLYTVEETESAEFQTAITTWPEGVEPGVFWSTIADEEYRPHVSKSTKLRSPIHRILHRAIAHTICGRSQSTGVVTVRDLFFLYCFIRPATCNVAYCLAQFLSQSMGRTQQGYICGGLYVTALARFYGFLTPAAIDSMLVVQPTQYIDKVMLLHLRVIERGGPGQFILLDGSGNPWVDPDAQAAEHPVDEPQPQHQQDIPEPPVQPPHQPEPQGPAADSSTMILSRLAALEQSVLGLRETVTSIQHQQGQQHHMLMEAVASIVAHLGIPTSSSSVPLPARDQDVPASSSAHPLDVPSNQPLLEP